MHAGVTSDFFRTNQNPGNKVKLSYDLLMWQWSLQFCTPKKCNQVWISQSGLRKLSQYVPNDLLISQLVPCVPGLQSHLYMLIRSWQSPPFLHGLESHSFISVRNQHSRSFLKILIKVCCLCYSLWSKCSANGTDYI